MNKKFLTLLTTLCLLIGLALPVLAAESATATSLRLNSTEGTVTLTNQNGKSLSLREDMKLYSGYTITTDAASYAYISLDDTKAVKLDAASSAEIKKNGKQLEVLLKSGNLFFNVTAPLEKDETLNIRTSTMVTGIRGTAGAVTQSSVFLLDGAVVLHTLDAATGEVLSTPLSAGQLATTDDGANTLHTEEFSAEDLPGFAGTEVAKDPVLQEKITQETKLDVPQIVQTAPEKLAQEQATQKAAADKVASAVASQPSIKTEAPPSAKPVPPQTSSAPDRDDDNSGDSSLPPVTTPAPPTEPPTVTPIPTEVILSEPVTTVDIQNALNQSGISIVRVQATSPVVLTADLTIPAGITLAVEAGELVLPSGTYFYINGNLSVATGALLTVSGVTHLAAGGTIENKGILTLSPGGSWNHRGELTSLSGGIFTIHGGHFNMDSGLLHCEDGPALTAPASFSLRFNGGLISSGTQPFVVSSNISFESPGVTAPATAVLRGELSGGDGYLLSVSFPDLIEALGSTGTIHISGAVLASQAATIPSDQDIIILFASGASLRYAGQLTVEGDLTLTGGTMDFDFAGTLVFSGPGTLTLVGCTVQATRNDFCSPLPDGYIVTSSGSYFVLTPSP